jgi:hypothetical protein
MLPTDTIKTLTYAILLLQIMNVNYTVQTEKSALESEEQLFLFVVV